MNKIRTILVSLCTVLLASCSENIAETPSDVTPEPWPHDAETLFQNAEALKYAVEEARQEDIKLKALGIAPNAAQGPTLPR